MIPSIGPHHGIPFNDYKSWQAINWHALEPFRISALYARHKMLFPSDATKQQVEGGAFHTAILEPEKFDSIYCSRPKFEGHANTKIHKAAKSAWERDHEHWVHLDSDEMSQLRGMQRAVNAHATASAILKAKGRNEISIVANEPETGELCKGRIDRLCKLPAEILDPHATGFVICLVDFKTTSQLVSFDGQVAKFGYQGQIALYETLLKQIDPTPITSLIVAIQSEVPHDVVVYSMTDAIEHGRKLYKRLLKQYIQCKKSGEYPGICPVGTMPVILPKWARED